VITDGGKVLFLGSGTRRSAFVLAADRAARRLQIITQSARANANGTDANADGRTAWASRRYNVGKYYGLQNDVHDAPILEKPSCRRARSTAASFDLLLRRHTRLLWWRGRTGNAVYWISNTLSCPVEQRCSLIAASTRQPLEPVRAR